MFPEDQHVEGIHDGTAEWNIYWDPVAAKRVWDSDVPITLVPLDVTNRVPVTEEFIRRFGKQQQYPFSVLAGSSWALTAGWKFRTNNHYFAWDVLTALYVLKPGAMTYEDLWCDVITEGISQVGRCQSSRLVGGGSWVQGPGVRKGIACLQCPYRGVCAVRCGGAAGLASLRPRTGSCAC